MSSREACAGALQQATSAAGSIAAAAQISIP
jgi:hypothetical protein